MKPKNILLLEDDPLAGETIQACLKQMGGPKSFVHWLYTEMDFVDHVRKIKAGTAELPDVIVSDVMLPWAFAGEFDEVPPEVRAGTFRRAGIRCHDLFRKEFGLPENNEKGPVWIYFTILDASLVGFDRDSDPRAMHVPKGDGADALRRAIESIP